MQQTSLEVLCREDRTAAQDGPAQEFSARVHTTAGFTEVYFDMKAVVTAILFIYFFSRGPQKGGKCLCFALTGSTVADIYQE